MNSGSVSKPGTTERTQTSCAFDIWRVCGGYMAEGEWGPVRRHRHRRGCTRIHANSRKNSRDITQTHATSREFTPIHAEIHATSRQLIPRSPGHGPELIAFLLGFRKGRGPAAVRAALRPLCRHPDALVAVSPQALVGVEALATIHDLMRMDDVEFVLPFRCVTPIHTEFFPREFSTGGLHRGPGRESVTAEARACAAGCYGLDHAVICAGFVLGRVTNHRESCMPHVDMPATPVVHDRCRHYGSGVECRTDIAPSPALPGGSGCC